MSRPKLPGRDAAPRTKAGAAKRANGRFESLTAAERAVLHQGLEMLLSNCRTDAEFELAEGLQAELSAARR